MSSNLGQRGGAGGEVDDSAQIQTRNHVDGRGHEREVGEGVLLLGEGGDEQVGVLKHQEIHNAQAARYLAEGPAGRNCRAKGEAPRSALLGGLKEGATIGGLAAQGEVISTEVNRQLCRREARNEETGGKI